MALTQLFELAIESTFLRKFGTSVMQFEVPSSCTHCCRTYLYVYIWLSLLYPVSCLVLPINNSHPVIKQMTFWVILLDYFLSINMKIWLSSPVLCLVYISADIELYPWMLMSLTEKGIYKALHTYKSWRSLHMLMLLILCVAQLYKLPTSSCALLHSIFTHKVLYSTFLNDKVKVVP